ncbi:MAG: HDOD domain-containing protein [Bacteroidota bacterium]
MQLHQAQWGISQWVEFLKDKETPVLPATRATLAALREGGEEARERLSALDMTAIVYADPYLALKLLRRAEQRRTRQLGHDTTTPLAAILQTGYDELEEIVANSPPGDNTLPGCRICESRAVLASGIARAWANRRVDVSPDEVAMAALLVETGELLLWHFAPEMTEKETLTRDWNLRYSALMPRPSEIEFTFRKLTMALALAWELPNLVVMLIKGTDTARANIARLAADIAKLIMDDAGAPALHAVLCEVNRVVPGASLEELIEPLPLSDDMRAALAEIIEAAPT